MQKARRHGIAPLRPLVGTRFQGLFHSFIQGSFHSPPGVLFNFPSLYYTLSVSAECLALAGGPAGFNLGFSCPDLLRILLTPTHFACTGFSPSLTGLSMPFQFFA